MLKLIYFFVKFIRFVDKFFAICIFSFQCDTFCCILSRLLALLRPPLEGLKTINADDNFLVNSVMNFVGYFMIY